MARAQMCSQQQQQRQRSQQPSCAGFMYSAAASYPSPSTGSRTVHSTLAQTRLSFSRQNYQQPHNLPDPYHDLADPPDPPADLSRTCAVLAEPRTSFAREFPGAALLPPPILVGLTSTFFVFLDEDLL